MIRKWLAVGIILLFILSALASSGNINSSNFRHKISANHHDSFGENKNWTFMAYLDGDAKDLEEDVPLFINNMELVGSSFIVNVIAQADDFTMWGGQTRRYYITYDTNPLVNDYNPENITSPLADPDTTEKNMGDPDTLSNFVKWSVENYPAEHYCLAIFNHGGGFWGLCWDSSSMGDKLTMPDFKEAMDNISKEIGKNLDLLILEPCCMGELEVYYQIKDYVDISIASEIPMNQAYISFQGIVQILTDYPSLPTVEIAQKIVDVCYHTFDGVCHHQLFGVQMDKIPEIAQAVDTLAQAFMADMPNKKILYKIYDYSHANEGIVEVANPLDLYRFAEKILDLIPSPGGIRDAAQEILILLNNSVIRPYEDENHSIYPCLNGIAIYFPPNEEFFHRYLDKYNELDFKKDVQWDEFLQEFFDSPDPKTRKSFLIGNLNNLTDLGDVVLFSPRRILVFQFFLPLLKLLTSGEKMILLLDRKIGFFTLNRIIGVFDVVV